MVEARVISAVSLMTDGINLIERMNARNNKSTMTGRKIGTEQSEQQNL